MKRLTVVLIASGLMLVPAALGKPPTGQSSVTIAASLNPVVFGSSTTISGQVTGKKAAGATVELQGEPFPSKAFSTVATVTANSTGHYSFTVVPTLNTMYRVMAKTAPSALSSNLLVRVRVKVTLHVSTTKPTPGQLVRFSGFVLPAYNGKVALIQRRTASGGWTTVARSKLAAAAPLGTIARSKFSKRVRVTKSGTYRVWFNPADNARLPNSSPTRKLTVT